MECIRQMILLVRRAPYSHAPAVWAQVHGLLCCALLSRPPPVIAFPAKILANIAHNHPNIIPFVLVAHENAFVAVVRHDTVPLAAVGEYTLLAGF